jgi:exopolysaccharide production protein ExoY
MSVVENALERSRTDGTNDSLERTSVSGYTPIKRIFDLALVLLFFGPIVLPVVGLLALLIRLDGHNAFHAQQRIGKGGHKFTLLKLRTMVPDAEAKLLAHLAQDPGAEEEWRRSQKLKKDPRITPLGGFLRKHSLDELPQLWNVLAGSMSLVGPRPMLPEQVPMYPGTAYFTLRPGLTGLWQISERNAGPFSSRAHYDAQYAREMSLLTDIFIIYRTARVVLRGTGV